MESSLNCEYYHSLFLNESVLLFLDSGLPSPRHEATSSSKVSTHISVKLDHFAMRTNTQSVLSQILLAALCVICLSLVLWNCSSNGALSFINSCSCRVLPRGESFISTALLSIVLFNALYVPCFTLIRFIYFGRVLGCHVSV